MPEPVRDPSQPLERDDSCRPTQPDSGSWSDSLLPTLQAWLDGPASSWSCALALSKYVVDHIGSVNRITAVSRPFDGLLAWDGAWYSDIAVARLRRAPAGSTAVLPGPARHGTGRSDSVGTR